MRRMRNPSSLHGTLVLQVVLPVVLLLAALLALAFDRLASITENRLQRDLQQVARAVELPVARALERGDEALLFSNLESVFELSEVYGAYVFDAHSRLQASFGTVLPSARQRFQAVSLGLNAEHEFDQYERISGRDVYSFFLPLFNTAGQPQGLLQVTRKRSDIDGELTKLQAWAWGGSLLLLLVLTGLLLLAHQRAIGKPLEQLLASMRRVRQGDMQHRAMPCGPAEIHGLARGLNRMLDAVAEAREQHREAHVARAAMADKLRQSESMALLGQIAGGVAHELGAPLSVVDGRARRILRGTQDQQVRRELESIREQAQRMQRLLEQLLSLGRNSREPLASADLLALAHNAIKQVPEGAERVAVVSGPEVRPRLRIQAFEQALANLLRNALQAAPDTRVELGWALDTAAGEWRLHVRDQGPGIPSRIYDSMFEPFVTSKRPGEGSGMGLAIVHRVVEEHGGRIEVESGSAGTCFVLCLPVSDDPGEQA